MLYDQGDLAEGAGQIRSRPATSSRNWSRPTRATRNGCATLPSASTAPAICSRATGDYQAALADYRTGLKATEILVGVDPDNAGWRFDMAISHNKIGYALWFAGDLAGALAAFDVSLSIDEDLVKRYPGQSDYQRHVTINLNWIGDLKRYDGKPAEALDPYERSRAITERLIAARSAEHALSPRPVRNSRQDRRRQAGAGRSRQGACCLSLGAGDCRISGGARPVQCRMAARSVDRPQPGRRPAARQAATRRRRPPNTRPASRSPRRCSTPTRKTSSASSTSPTAATSSRWQASTASANLKAARDAMAALKAEGRLPPAFESWVTMVDEALK